MARIRTVKPGLWKHEELSELPAETHMLAAAILNYADDEGYFNANPKLVTAECFPLRDLSVSVHDSLMYLWSVGYIDLGTGKDGKRYGRVVTFLEHQRVNRPKSSEIKDVGIVWDERDTNHQQISDDASPEGKGREVEREQGKEKDISSNASRRTDECSDPDPDPSPEPPDPEPDTLGSTEDILGNSEDVTEPETPEDALLTEDQAPAFKPADLIAERFKDFWAEYPRREAKPAAEKTFAKKVRDRVKGQMTPEKINDAADFIIEGAQRYAADCRAKGTEKNYIKMAQGWLNEERYADGTDEDLLDIPPGLRRDRNGGPSAFTDPEHAERLRAQAAERVAGGVQ
ncbi:MAG: hypothetical protein RIA64_01350 [Rhodospirillales bacterium]